MLDVMEIKTNNTQYWPCKILESCFFMKFIYGKATMKDNVS